MSYAPHVFFAKDEAGYCVSARDTYALKRGSFFCLGCGKIVRLAGSESLPHFRHQRGQECPAAGQKALLAAAQAMLSETRFIKTPARGHNVFDRLHKHTYIGHEQWLDSASNAEVDGVQVDFVAERGEGKLLIHISIPGMLDTARRELVRQLNHPSLEVVLAKPADIDSFGELSRILLHDVENKRWLLSDDETATLEQQDEFTPVMALAAEEFRVERFKTTTRVVVDGWVSPGALVGNAFYRDLVSSAKMAELERLLGAPREKWPADIGLTVRGQECFGVEHLVWQADLYARFVAGAEGVRDEPFTSEQALKYLSERYAVTAIYQNAPVLAVYWYLRELVIRGALLETIRGRFRVIINEELAERRLVWHPYCMLSVSKLRQAATDAGLNIPVPAFRWLLENFESGRPALPVAAFVQLFSIHSRAPLRKVIAFFIQAELMSDVGKGQAPRQASLFDA
jgi:hypothetical protein